MQCNAMQCNAMQCNGGVYLIGGSWAPAQSAGKVPLVPGLVPVQLVVR